MVSTGSEGKKRFLNRKVKRECCHWLQSFSRREAFCKQPYAYFFLTPFEHSNSKSPKKRRRLVYQKETATSVIHAGPSEVTPVDNSGIPASDELMKSGDDSSGLTLCTACAQITRDADVRLCTGMQNTDAFRTLFEYLLPKT